MARGEIVTRLATRRDLTYVTWGICFRVTNCIRTKEAIRTQLEDGLHEAGKVGSG